MCTVVSSWQQPQGMAVWRYGISPKDSAPSLSLNTSSQVQYTSLTEVLEFTKCTVYVLWKRSSQCDPLSLFGSTWLNPCTKHGGKWLPGVIVAFLVYILFQSTRDCLCNPHSLPVWGCSWHWSGDFLASGGMDHCCKVWDAQRYLWACWWGGGSYGYGLWFQI